MRIAMFTNNYKPFIAGVPISIERLSNGLRKKGHKVTIFAPSYRAATEEDDIVRYRSCFEGIAGGVVIPAPVDRRIEEAFRKGHFDVIHVHHPMVIGKTAIYLSHKYHVPMVFTYHTRYEQYLHYVMPKVLLKNEKIIDFTETIIASYMKHFFKSCSHIFVPTKGMSSYLSKGCGYDSHRISELPTGLEENSYHDYDAESETVRNVYHADGMPLFITVSRMSKEKNVYFLLKSLKKFKELYKKPFRMLLIGDGPELEEIKEEAVRLGLYGHENVLDDQVVFVGRLPNELLSAYYSACDLFLFASKSETQGIVLLEAFAAGLPVVGVKASGVSDLVMNDVNGYTVEEDINTFAKKVLFLINDSITRGSLSEGARISADHYRESLVASNALAQYNKVVMEYDNTVKKDGEKRKWNISIVS